MIDAEFHQLASMASCCGLDDLLVIGNGAAQSRRVGNPETVNGPRGCGHFSYAGNEKPVLA